MNKTFKTLNIILIALILIGDLFYMTIGGIIIKSITSLLFVALGIVNFIYAKKSQTLNNKFCTLMLLGLIFAMLGDILLEIEFIVGAALFAIGHIFYFAAYTALKKFKIRDLLFAAVIFVPSQLILLFVPVLNFGGILMQIVCIIYALIISLMVGKSISNLTQEKTLLNILLVVGSCLFYISDFMLVFDVFANISVIFGILCLSTYYPAEAILAYSISKSNK